MSDIISTQQSTEGAQNSSVPSCIRPEHKKKYAIVYPRQSSPFQVKNNTGSTESQRALANLPLAWGWPPELVLVIEDDLGLSATSPNHRGGFQRVEAMMDRGEVGLVMVRDAARLSRDPAAGERFLKKAIRARVLLEENGQLVDLARSRPVEIFGLRLHNLLAWWDNEQRRENFQAAKFAKIRQGKAVSRPQIGYITPAKGEWVKEQPETGVPAAIRHIIDAYLGFLSIRKAARTLRSRGIKFPRRVRGRLEWEEMTDAHVYRVLTNPNYTADYHYRRRQVTRDEDTGQLRSERRHQSDWLIIKNHHEPYISHDEWHLIQSSLQRRGRGRQPAAGKGAGLLQGLLACGRCDGRWMRTLHDGRAADGQPGRIARYSCHRVDKFGTTVHRMSCSAAGVDHVVFRAFVDALAPVGIETALAAVRDDQAQQDAADLARRRQLHRAEEHVLELKRHYFNVDPSRHALKVELEQELDNALRDLNDLRRTLSEVPATVSLTEADAAELVSLASKLETTWHAPSTTNEDRKQLLATVITKILVRDLTEDALDLEILWVSGTSERRRVLTAQGGTQLLTKMREDGRPVSEILATMTELGITTQRGRLFSRKALQHKLWVLGFDMKGPRLEALRLIRSMLIAERPRQEILDTLRRRGPRPYEGEWTRERLASAIKSIQTGAWAPEIPPLPTNVPRLRRLAPEVIQLFAHGRKMGWTFRQIVDELNAQGFRTPRGSRFTFLNAYQLYQHLKADFSLTNVLPSEPPPATHAKGKRGRRPYKHLAGTESPLLHEQHSEGAS